jgi:YD repeat-containing protein
MTMKKNGKAELLIYYDANNHPDSTVEVFMEPKRTTYFYKTKYRDHYARYSVVNGVPQDFISYEFDTAHHQAIFFFDGKVSSIDSFDAVNNLVKKTLVESNTFETYTYDAFGNIENEYTRIRLNNRDSLFNFRSHVYEYDTRKNWTKQTTTRRFPNGGQQVYITIRKITY